MFRVNDVKEPSVDSNKAFLQAFPDPIKLEAYYQTFQPWIQKTARDTYIDSHLKQFVNSLGIFEEPLAPKTEQIKALMSFKDNLAYVLELGVGEDSKVLYQEILKAGILDQKLQELMTEQAKYEEQNKRMNLKKYLLKQSNILQ